MESNEGGEVPEEEVQLPAQVANGAAPAEDADAHSHLSDPAQLAEPPTVAGQVPTPVPQWEVKHPPAKPAATAKQVQAPAVTMQPNGPLLQPPPPPVQSQPQQQEQHVQQMQQAIQQLQQQFLQPQPVQPVQSLPPPQPVTVSMSAEDENRLVDTLLNRMQTLGFVKTTAASHPAQESTAVTLQPVQGQANTSSTQPNTAEPERQPTQSTDWWQNVTTNPQQTVTPTYDSNQNWNWQESNQNWKEPNQNWQEQNWKDVGWKDWTKSWKDDHYEARDIPYLSHIDFPTFSGTNEGYAS